MTKLARAAAEKNAYLQNPGSLAEGRTESRFVYFIRFCAVLAITVAASCSAGTNTLAPTSPTLPQSPAASLRPEPGKALWGVGVGWAARLVTDKENQEYCFPAGCKPGLQYYPNKKYLNYDPKPIRQGDAKANAKVDNGAGSFLGSGDFAASLLTIASKYHTAFGTDAGGAGFFDEIYVSSTLKKGTPVIIDARLVVSPGAPHVHCAYDVPIGSANGTGTDAYGNEDLFLIAGCSEGSIVWSIEKGPVGLTDVGTIATTVGAHFSIRGLIAAGCTATVRLPPGVDSCLLVPGYNYYLTPEDKNVTIKSASGHDYSPPPGGTPVAHLRGVNRPRR